MSSNDKTVTTKETKNDEKTTEKTPSVEASTEATTASSSTEVKSSEAKSTEVKLTDAKSAKGKPIEVKPTEVQTEEKETSSKTVNEEKKGVLLGHRILRDFSKDYNKKTPTYFVGIITEYQPSENSSDIKTIFPSKKNTKGKKKEQSDLDSGLYRIRYLDKDKDEVPPSDAYVGCKLYNTLNKQKVYTTDLKTIFDKVKYPNPKNKFLMTDLVEEEKYYYECYQDYLQDQKIEPATLVVPADEVCSKEELVLTEYGYVPASAFDDKIMKRIVEQEATTTPKKRGRPKGSSVKTPEGSKSRGAKIVVKYTPVVTPKRKRGVSSVEKDRVKTTPAAKKTTPNAKKQNVKKNKTPSATVEPMVIDKKDDAMDVDEKNDASKTNVEKALPPPQDKKVEDKSEEKHTDQINSTNGNVNKTLGTSASAAKIIDSKVNKMQEVDLTQDDDDASDKDKKRTAAEVDLTQDDDDSADNDKKPTAAEVDLTQDDDDNDDEKNKSKKTNDKVAETANETKDAKQSTVTAATASPKKSAIDTASAATKTDGTPDKPKEEDKNATAAATAAATTAATAAVTNNEIKKDVADNSAAKDAK